MISCLLRSHRGKGIFASASRRDNESVSIVDTNRDDKFMLIGVAYPIKCPEKTIPSFVWLEQRNNAKISSGRSLQRFLIWGVPRYCSPEREFSVVGVTDSRSDSDSISDLCGSLPKIARSVHGYGCKIIRKRLGEFEFVNILSSSRIIFNNLSIWFLHEKNVNPLMKVREYDG